MSQDIFDTRFEGKDIELTSNRVNLDDDIILSDKDPALQNLTVAVGWDSKAFGGQAVDVDISLFLLDKDDMTRKNEDFVFYNQMDTEEGAIKHEGDNRIGAGEGDDETILIDLHGIPYDILESSLCTLFTKARSVIKALAARKTPISVSSTIMMSMNLCVLTSTSILSAMTKARPSLAP